MDVHRPITENQASYGRLASALAMRQCHKFPSYTNADIDIAHPGNPKHLFSGV